MRPRKYTVTELIEDINDRLTELTGVIVEAEVSTFKVYPSGHWYFTVKDEQSSMSCKMWRSRNSGLTPLRVGDKIYLKGYPQIYAQNGSFGFITDKFKIAGEGELYEKFLRLKRELEALGWFAPEIKKPIPRIPHRIGIITSAQSAALRDALHRLQERAPYAQVTVYNTPVQGKGNEYNIAEAIRTANRIGREEVLLLIRGGGSLEELWNFNERVVAQAVYESQIPIITGVGHETDTTIADLAADLRAPTPTAAAEAAAERREVLLQEADQPWNELCLHFRRAADLRQQRVDHNGRPFESSDSLLFSFRRHLALAFNIGGVDIEERRLQTRLHFDALKMLWSNQFEIRCGSVREASVGARIPTLSKIEEAGHRLTAAGRLFDSYSMVLSIYRHQLDGCTLEFNWPIREKAEQAESHRRTIVISWKRFLSEQDRQVRERYQWVARALPAFSSVRLEAAAKAMERSMTQKLFVDKSRFQSIDKIIELMEKFRKLPSGTAFVLKNGIKVDSVGQIQSGDQVEIVLPDGSFDARVGAVRL